MLYQTILLSLHCSCVRKNLIPAQPSDPSGRIESGVRGAGSPRPAGWAHCHIDVTYVCVYLLIGEYEFVTEHFGFHLVWNPKLKCTWQWLLLSWLQLKHCLHKESSRCCHQMPSTLPKPFQRCWPRRDLCLHLSPQLFCLPCQQPWL